VEEELLNHCPAANVRRPRLDYESHATGLDRNELGALLVAAGLAPAAEHALISLLALNGLRVSKATGADIHVPAPRAAPALQVHQFGHQCQAVRCPRHNLALMLATTSAGAKRPAAQPLPGRHRQPAHTAPARLPRHQLKLTRRPDIAAVAGRSEEDVAAVDSQRDLLLPIPRCATLLGDVPRTNRRSALSSTLLRALCWPSRMGCSVVFSAPAVRLALDPGARIRLSV
jgi:hypothetical protein